MSLPTDLVAAFSNQRAGIFVGAGASRDAKLPTWKSLLDELIEKAGATPGITKDSIADYQSLVADQTKHLVLASILKEELAQNFGKYIEKRFADEDLEPTAIDRALVDLPAQFFITTNYDRLVERAYAEKFSGKKTLNTFTYKQVGQAASGLFRNRPFILHAHGDAASEPDDVILTEKDYRLLIHNSTGYQSLLQTLFTTFTLLFVGTSLADMEVRLLLGFIHSSFHGKTPTHYALMSDNERNPSEIRAFFRDFNIEVIGINHNSLTKSSVELLTQLQKESGKGSGV
jgi:hypothetical protein